MEQVIRPNCKTAFLEKNMLGFAIKWVEKLIHWLAQFASCENKTRKDQHITYGRNAAFNAEMAETLDGCQGKR